MNGSRDPRRNDNIPTDVQLNEHVIILSAKTSRSSWGRPLFPIKAFLHDCEKQHPIQTKYVVDCATNYYTHTRQNVEQKSPPWFHANFLLSIDINR